MVDWCKKYWKPAIIAKSKCPKQCSSRCEKFGYISISQLTNWNQKEPTPSPPQPPPPPQPKKNMEKPSKIEWKLIDANVFKYAKEEGEKAEICLALLGEDGLATTDMVLNELIRLNVDIGDIDLKIFIVTKIEQELLDTWIGDREKQASIADKSLIQAAVNDHSIIGIITYDKDFIHIGAKGYVERKSNYKRQQFWVLNAEEYLIRKGRIRRGQK